MSVVQNKDINSIVFRRNNIKVFSLNFGDVKYFIKGLKRSYLMGIFYDPSKQMIACDGARGENSDESQPDNCAVGA